MRWFTRSPERSRHRNDGLTQASATMGLGSALVLGSIASFVIVPSQRERDQPID